MSLSVTSLSGQEVDAVIPVLARLRIRVFREWPYLYDGDLAYEETYLKRFRDADRAILVTAQDAGEIVGAATATPLAQELPEFQAPFQAAGYNIASIFYFAESLALPQYRGLGLGHAFFDARETHARSYGTYTDATFCAVIRPDDHPSRPDGYRPLDTLWQKRGYRKLDDMVTTFGWKDLGEAGETGKPMQFWMGSL